MVIIRERNRCISQTYKITVRFEAYDAKKDLQRHLSCDLLSTSLTKTEIRLLYLKGVLREFSRKNATNIAEWLFNTAVSKGYLFEIPSIRAETRYMINPEIMPKKLRRKK